jgi:uncharacterized membrane protein (UPF0127 family)
MIRWGIRNRRNDRAVATRIEAAFESRSRRQGLLGRSQLAQDTALILAPCSAIHTFFMRFPIDVLFVDEHGRILRISRALKPWRLAWAWSAFAVLELQANALSRSDTREEDVLYLNPE